MTDWPMSLAIGVARSVLWRAFQIKCYDCPTCRQARVLLAEVGLR